RSAAPSPRGGGAIWRKWLLLFPFLLVSCSPEKSIRDDWDLFRKADPFFSAFIQPDGKLLWRLKSGRYDAEELLSKAPEGAQGQGGVAAGAALEINSRGFRGKEVGAKKGFRVLCLGDSVTFGYARPYPEILEAGLRVRLPGEETQVINAGVPGYSIRQLSVWFEEELEKLNPDAVVLLTGWNDAKDYVRGYTDGELLSSRWARMLAHFRHPPAPNRSLDPLSRRAGCCRVPPEDFEKTLAHLVAQVKGSGAALYAASYPSLFDFPGEQGGIPPELAASRKKRLEALAGILQKAAEREKFAYVPLAEEVRQGASRSYFANPADDPVHPSEDGAAFIARLIEERVAAAALSRKGAEDH
ncbi:MAG: SGNH/GDSL hydrolase family protein, partial [Bdellovibrionota bacterium]